MGVLSEAIDLIEFGGFSTEESIGLEKIVGCKYSQDKKKFTNNLGKLMHNNVFTQTDKYYIHNLFYRTYGKH